VHTRKPLGRNPDQIARDINRICWPRYRSATDSQAGPGCFCEGGRNKPTARSFERLEHSLNSVQPFLEGRQVRREGQTDMPFATRAVLRARANRDAAA
jgi:hypothetical protein